MEIVLDAGPLIYLAKLDAIEVVERAGMAAVVPPTVFAEVARPELAFRHPEVAIILGSRDRRQLAVVDLTGPERRLATDLESRTGGLHPGELEVLALGRTRSWPVCVHERQAARLARALGVRTIDLVELLFAGTTDAGLLEVRVRAFARLTNLTMNDLDALLRLVDERR